MVAVVEADNMAADSPERMVGSMDCACAAWDPAQLDVWLLLKGVCS